MQIVRLQVIFGSGEMVEEEELQVVWKMEVVDLFEQTVRALHHHVIAGFLF